MRAADFVTLVRVLLVFPVAYGIIAMATPYVMVPAIVIMFALDGLDGFATVYENSKGKVGLLSYIRMSFGSDAQKRRIAGLKRANPGRSKMAQFGARMDIAGDRVTEYAMWVTYGYLNIIPLFAIFIVLIRHAFVDALMGAKGTSSKMKSRLARIVYTSKFGRAGSIFLKVATFAYLDMAYAAGYPLYIGQALAAVLIAFILLRGWAEVTEALG